MADKVRMADIAQKLGVSVVSVSKALGGREGVGDALRAQIIKTAREMGYAIPPTAGLKRSYSVGILVQERFFSESTFYYTLYRELLTACQARNLIALNEIVSYRAEADGQLPALLKAGRTDGLIFMGEFESRWLRPAVASGPAHVFLDFHSDEIPACCVVSDNLRGGCELTLRLLRAGRRRIAFVGSVRATASIMDRYLGYVRAHLLSGCAPDLALRVEDRDALGRFVPLALPDPMPDAFVCSCDEVAYKLVGLIRARGLRVPEDVAVTGYDNFRYALLSEPALTTWLVDVSGMAEAAAELLLRQLRGEKVARTPFVVPGHLSARASG